MSAIDAHVSALWTRARAVLQADAPEVLATLRPGANDTTLARLTALCPPGMWPPEVSPSALDPAVLALLRLHDGQADGTEVGVFFGFLWLSVDAIVREWTRWEELRTRSTTEDLRQLGSAWGSVPPGAIHAVYTHPGWIPLFQEPLEGNFIGLDYAPGPAGAPGQIIPFGRDEDAKRVLAPDFSALLEWYVEELESGALNVEREADGTLVALTHTRGRVTGVLAKRARQRLVP